MAATTFEEAKVCPKCGQPGEDVRNVPAKGIRGARVHTIYCRKDGCKWYNTCWFVQVNKDGSIPPAMDHSRTPKQYEGFQGHDQMAIDLVNELKRASALQELPGSEIRKNR